MFDRKILAIGICLIPWSIVALCAAVFLFDKLVMQ